MLLADGLTEDAQLESRDRAAARRTARPARWPRPFACRSTRASCSAGRGPRVAGGGAQPAASGCPARALRQRAGAPPGRAGRLQRTRGPERTGQVARPLRAPLQDRALGRSDRARRRADRRGVRRAASSSIARTRARDPAGTDRLPAGALGEPAPRGTRCPAGCPSGSASTCRGCSRIPSTATTSSWSAATRSYIPEFNPIVMVQGAVNSPGPVAYTPGKNLDWYVDAAGGYTQRATRAIRT